ncbi:MAG: relaxase/mobilization nuclease domain-containing protein [Hyphomicrobiales bacterium]|nr:relaxase/mobilization nuclease domain-containing protein [Hyphomicrobiales bacterium]
MVPDIAKKGHSFDGALAYYLHDKGSNTAERVAWTETRNLMTDDPQAAKRIMIATALQSDELKKQAGIKSSGRKSNQHVYAYALSWHPDEAGTLDKAQMMAAVESSLKELQADHLQAVVVCHTDQKHPHVHVILNRVDSYDGKMHPFKNDRLQLSDWANQYERDRGEILTPAREEKRQEREQHKDKKARQDYAKRKRDEAFARPKDDLSPAAMLKDLSAAQKDRHRQEWSDISAKNKAKRNAIYDEYRKRIRDAAALHKQEVKPFWRDHFKNERDRKKGFDDRETNIIGVVQNAMSATAYEHMQGELDGRGKLSATFSNVLSSQKRRTIFERRLDLDRRALGAELKAVLDDEIQSIQAQRKDALKDQRAAFDQSRCELIERQDAEWQKVREAWKQLRGRSYRRYQRSADPVKKDFDNSRRPDPAKPKPQPTRKATVSTPSPAPSPTGEVPRSTAKQQTVPKSKDWSKSSTLTAGQGITRAKPVKKDWEKTGASAAKVEKPKDWGKKVERKGEVKKAPTPRRDLDRSR